jgi:hypothetical protein
MDISNFVDSIGGEFTIQIGAVIATILILIVAIIYGKNRLGKMSEAWTQVAQMNGLEYATNALQIDYGLVVGTHTFEYPGMAGNFRGHEVMVQSNIGMERGDAGKGVIEAVVMLKNPKPFSALAYKRGFENLAKERVKKDSKTGNNTIDKAFKVRSDDIHFVSQNFDNGRFAAWLKQEKLRSAHLMFDGNRLKFLGVVNGSQVKPELAISALTALCELADVAN